MPIGHIIIDVETTGLDRNKCAVLEIACVLLDERLQPVASIATLINDVATCVIDPADTSWIEEGAMKLHEKTGLAAEIREGKGISSIQASEAIIAWLNNTPNVATRLVLVGNNPEFDRAFVKRVFPDVYARLHYRSIDVSTLREIAALASGLTTDRLKSAIGTKDAMKHRALADCQFCHAEMMRYAVCFNGGQLLETLKSEGSL